MRITIVAYVSIAVAIILMCLLCPYGSRVFEMIVWWPIFGTLIAAAICFVFWAKGLVKRILPIQIAFFLSVPVASIVTQRNHLFVTEVAGVVAERYVGGHALKSVQIKTPNGELYRIEGLPDVTWGAVSVGDSFAKGRGFQLNVAGQDCELFRDGNLFKSNEPIRGEQVSGGNGGQAR